MSLQWVYRSLVVAMSAAVLFACSDEGETPAPGELPSFEDLNVTIGQSGKIRFEVASAWTMSANKVWLKLSQQTGVAGVQEVDYMVNAGAQGFQDDVAEVTFMMDGKATSFTVTRTAKDRMGVLINYEQTDNGMQPIEVEKLEVTYMENSSSYQTNYAVRANFNWKISFPEWVLAENLEGFSGTANPDEERPAYYWIGVDYTKALAEDMTGEVEITDMKDPTQKIVKTITCPGSDKYMISNAAVSLTFDDQGQYLPTSPSGDTPEPLPGYEFTAISGNEGLVFFKIARDANGYFGVVGPPTWSPEYNAAWCRIFDDPSEPIGPHVINGHYFMNCAPNDTGEKRFATVVALPAKMAEGLTPGDLVLSGDEELKPEYVNYVISEVVQTVPSGGLEFSMGVPEGMTLEVMPEGDERDGIASNYGVEVIYVLTINSFAQANMAGINFPGYAGDEMTPIYEPAESQMSEPQGWIEATLGIGQHMTFDISDDKAPFTSSRSTLIIAKEQSTWTNHFAIKVVQNVARN